MRHLSALDEALGNAREHLLAQRGAHGHWEGQLSSSALSTAIAVCAMDAYRAAAACSDAQREQLRGLSEDGVRWLVDYQNTDGGWGDTTLSKSNISTTALCWAAFSGRDEEHRQTVAACEDWLKRAVGASSIGASSPETHDSGKPLEPAHLALAVKKRYGKDHTFSVPILTTLALTGRLGPTPHAWRLVPQLPFELAAFPHAWYARLRLPVVSYALPALIAIGQVRHYRQPSWNVLLRFLRNLVRERTLRVLREIQPDSGGYLEATPLTGFVSLSLIGAGRADHPVVSHALRFLINSVRPDGSWAIDSNLATWVTTLAIGALHAGGDLEPALSVHERGRLRDWLCAQQYKVQHPYTHARPGGWAWTDLPGGVPDADDTSGSLLALHSLDDGSDTVLAAAEAGIRWLLDLQNADGGIPTFCRGWGTLPFDRSSADLTAHALRAWLAWRDRMPSAVKQRLQRATDRGLRYLAKVQRSDGSWAPLWFGNQHVPDETNLVYGTSRVLLAAAAIAGQAGSADSLPIDARAAMNWLLDSQNTDGGWGGAPATPSSIEETALAVEALCAVRSMPGFIDSPGDAELVRCLQAALSRGAASLIDQTDCGRRFPPTPIGFYFAKLWYFERLYPVVYTTAALGRAFRLARDVSGMESPHQGTMA